MEFELFKNEKGIFDQYYCHIIYRSGERSTKLLVGIVIVFLICHVSRLVIQIEAIIHPSVVGKW